MKSKSPPITFFRSQIRTTNGRRNKETKNWFYFNLKSDLQFQAGLDQKKKFLFLIWDF